MKKHLFYTFLFIYLITALVTLSSLIGIIKIDDKYLSQLVPALLVETAVAIIGLFKKTNFFEDPKEQIEEYKKKEVRNIGLSKTREGERVKELIPTEPTNAQIPSIEEYYRLYYSFDERFREQHNFVDKWNGKTVEWKGKVMSVSKIGNNNLSVHLFSLREDSNDSVIAKFDKTKEVDLYSLRKGDIIQVRGVLDLSVPNQALMACTDFTFMHQQ